jgi:hypothetical protein
LKTIGVKSMLLDLSSDVDGGRDETNGTLPATVDLFWVGGPAVGPPDRSTRDRRDLPDGLGPMRLAGIVDKRDHGLKRRSRSAIAAWNTRKSINSLRRANGSPTSEWLPMALIQIEQSCRVDLDADNNARPFDVSEGLGSVTAKNHHQF